MPEQTVLRPVLPQRIPVIEEATVLEQGYVTLTKSDSAQQSVADELRAFVVDNFLFGDDKRAPKDDDSLVLGGIIDSTGILELIEFLESRYRLQVTETETIPENLDSLSRLTRFVLSKASPTDGQ